MKKRVLLAMMSAFLLTGCTFSTTPPFIRGEGPMFGGQGSNSYAYNDTQEKRSEPEKSKSKKSESKKSESKDKSSEKNTITTEPVDMSRYSTSFGNDDYGYLDLDSYWIDFAAEGYVEESNNILQFGTVGPVEDSFYLVTLAAYHSTADYAINNMVKEDEEDPNVTEILKAQAGDIYKDGAHVSMYYSLTEASDYTNLCCILCIDRANSDDTHYIAIELVDENAGDVNESIFAAEYKKILDNYSEIQILKDVYPSVDLTDIYSILD